LDHIPENIKDGIDIYGVGGTFEWSAWWDLWTRETVIDINLDFFYYKKIWDLYLMWWVQFDWMSSTNYPIRWWLALTRERIRDILWKTTIVSYLETTVWYANSRAYRWWATWSWHIDAEPMLVAMVLI
jgi:hypothetical protein